MFRNLQLRLVAQNVFFRDTNVDGSLGNPMDWYGKESGKIKTASLIDMVDNMLNLLMKM
ncbi:hypothetical protein [Bacillus cereus]|uniref:hypothetical protein n=1 Tax=Bacillus cereus TaxID=1396 RepID=UPI001C3EC2AF|nr:hypothetical protein [Bacillus cereus]